MLDGEPQEALVALDGQVAGTAHGPKRQCRLQDALAPPVLQTIGHSVLQHQLLQTTTPTAWPRDAGQW